MGNNGALKPGTGTLRRPHQTEVQAEVPLSPSHAATRLQEGYSTDRRLPGLEVWGKKQETFHQETGRTSFP